MLRRSFCLFACNEFNNIVSKSDKNSRILEQEEILKVLMMRKEEIVDQFQCYAGID